MNYWYTQHRGLLRLFNRFSEEVDEQLPPFEYEQDAEGLLRLRETYRLDDIAGSGPELERILNLLHWLYEHTEHYGSLTGNPPMNALALLERAFDKGRDGGINCRMLATILAEVYLALGFKARLVSLHPIYPFDLDNHVVVLVWLASQGKWISVDPSFNAYFVDAAGTVLNPWELRRCMAEQADVRPNEEARFGDDPAAAAEQLMAYMAKDLFSMHSPRINTFGSEERRDQQWINLIPQGFEVEEREQLNTAWRSWRFGIDEKERAANGHFESYFRVREWGRDSSFLFTASAASFSRAPAA